MEKTEQNKETRQAEKTRAGREARHMTPNSDMREEKRHDALAIKVVMGEFMGRGHLGQFATERVAGPVMHSEC
ncbi:hypothetical protein E2C01_068346 [Portunus trituberculatus]|uniref:Uncharacterized protein n=1 Tax=Portunus trituberculatus TaxID=210409 RepID=A0A5B7HRQ6_PORTR|nr:hypothetical protein [Portunus trituberculatus]